VASQGIAEHSHYKIYGDSSSAIDGYNRARKWVQGLLEMQKRAGNSMEFIETVKTDLFPDEVYVFSPKGRIFELPQGATAVDFAYAVHTDIGNSCVSCRINRRLAPLSQPLHSGQTVEIITTPSAQPNMAWLNFVITGKARSAIRHFIKVQHRGESIELGRRLLTQFLSNYGSSIEEIDPAALATVLQEAELKSLDELLQDIGMGNRMAYVVARRLRPVEHEEDEPQELPDSNKATLAIRGTEGMVLHYARCCGPIPGDSITGHISTGRGLVIHRTDCRNIAFMKDDAEKCVYLEWSNSIDEEFIVNLDLKVEPKRGLIATLATTASGASANVLKIDITETDDALNTVHIDLTVKDRVHLAKVMRNLKALKAVYKVTRV
jgi:(p)ppGpp synthase/HD superfamily hydrolase